MFCLQNMRYGVEGWELMLYVLYVGVNTGLLCMLYVIVPVLKWFGMKFI